MSSQNSMRRTKSKRFAGCPVEAWWFSMRSSLSSIGNLNRHPPRTTSIVKVTEHTRIAQWDILEFIRNPEYESPPWPEGYWPPEGTRANRAEWQQTLSAIRKDTQDLLDIVHDPHTDLYAPIPHAPDYTIFREILVAADHFSYHLGEFGLLRSALRL